MNRAYQSITALFIAHNLFSQKNIKKKTKSTYKTYDELVASGGKKPGRKEIQSEIAKGKVIDMTGREQRVFTGKAYTVDRSRRF